MFSMVTLYLSVSAVFCLSLSADCPITSTDHGISCNMSSGICYSDSLADISCLMINSYNSNDSRIVMIAQKRYDNDAPLVLEYTYATSMIASYGTAGIVWNIDTECFHYYYIGISYTDNSVFLAQLKNDNMYILHNASLPFMSSLGTFYRLQCEVSNFNMFTISVNGQILLWNVSGSTGQEFGAFNARFGYVGIANTDSSIIVKSLFVSGSSIITTICEPMSATNTTTLSSTYLETKNANPTWNICTDKTECAYIANITFQLKWSAVYGYGLGEYLSTASVLADIITDIIQNTLKTFISVSNMLITMHINSLTDMGESEANIMVATDDRDAFGLLFKDIAESGNMVNNVSTLLSNSSFIITYIEGKIMLIKPETMDETKEKDDNINEFIFVIIIVGTLVLGGFICNKFRSGSGKRRASDINNEAWSPSSRLAHSVKNTQHITVHSFEADDNEIELNQFNQSELAM